MEGGDIVSVGERIKKLRKALDLTQQEFSSRIGSTANVLTNYETGRRNPSGSVVNNICKEFNVSETWLRTGEGEMFIQLTKEDELKTAVEALLSGESSDFKRRLIKVLVSLKEEQWAVLEEKLKEIVGSEDKPDTAQALTLEQEADQFAAMAREQFLLEKSMESQVPSAKESDAG